MDPRDALDALASMRPARKGPENHEQPPQSYVLRLASMRPARKGPENRSVVPAEDSTPPTLQ